MGLQAIWCGDGNAAGTPRGECVRTQSKDLSSVESGGGAYIQERFFDSMRRRVRTRRERGKAKAGALCSEQRRKCGPKSLRPSRQTSPGTPELHFCARCQFAGGITPSMCASPTALRASAKSPHREGGVSSRTEERGWILIHPLIEAGSWRVAKYVCRARYIVPQQNDLRSGQPGDFFQGEPGDRHSL
jgi:hypothetical protein